MVSHQLFHLVTDVIPERSLSGSVAMGRPDSMTQHTPSDSLTAPGANWRGLGGWNLYFLGKLALLWGGYLNFHPLANLVFAAFLLFPLSSTLMRRVRLLIALPAGVGLFYHDTWLPGIESIMGQGKMVFSFTFDYFLELLGRFINWNIVGVAFVMLTGYLFLARWLRFTPWMLISLLWLTLSPHLASLGLQSPFREAQAQANVPGGAAVASMPVTASQALDQGAAPTNDNLNAYLDRFYQSERDRRVSFATSLPADAEPFDVLLLQICSLSWSDIEASGLTDHPLLSRFDALFKSFNSSTSYSGPAAIRLLRSSCGQVSHHDLYQAPQAECLLMDNLARLGFAKEIVMDHSGTYGNDLKSLKAYAGVSSEPMDKQGLPYEVTSFIGEEIPNSDALLARWLQRRVESPSSRNIAYFNITTLHDGNRWASSRQIAPFKARLRALMDQLDGFITRLEQSGRKVMVVMVPEHGAALSGDRLQMSGLRDIPSPAITRVPVGIRLVGARAEHAPTRVIDQPSSLLVISELVARVVAGNYFGSDTIDWGGLFNNLPQTPAVSENQGASVIQYQGQYYIKQGKGDWVPYPR